MNGDEVKKHTKVIKRSREPHWEDEEIVFPLRGTLLDSYGHCQSTPVLFHGEHCKMYKDLIFESGFSTGACDSEIGSSGA